MASLETASPESSCLEALAIALQYPAVSADERNIRTLLQVSKGWRTAVQQSAAGLTDISFYNAITVDSFSTIGSFGVWLSKHSGLICKLSIYPLYYGSTEFVAMAEEAMQHHVEFGLQAAAVGTAAAPAAAVTVSQQVGHQLTTWLRSFISSVPPTAAMLAALPAATLTTLELDKVSNNDWYLGVSQLTSLQQKGLNMEGLEPQHPATHGCVIATSNLEMLTRLRLRGVPPGLDTRLIPVQLRELNLTYRHGSSNADPALEDDRSTVVDLQHLTRLRQLRLDARELAAGSSMPCYLSNLMLSLEWWVTGSLSGLSSLNQLTSVELNIYHMGSQQLETFKQLTQLQRLSMVVCADAVASEVANAWGNQPLCDLRVWRRRDTSYSDVLQLMQRIGQATTLTKLELDIKFIVPDHPGAEKLAVCRHLSTLTVLQELVLGLGSPADFVEHDDKHLAALTTLTSLVCPCLSGPSLDAITLWVLAEKLTSLKVLIVNRCCQFAPEVSSLAALPAIGRLTTLEVLGLEYLQTEAAQQGPCKLQLLTDLTRLTELTGFDWAGHGALQAFWNSIKSRRTSNH